MAQKKKRRRITRLSDAVDYDRTADRDSGPSLIDHDRMVILDSELFDDDVDADAASHSLDYYKEQQPPHYGM